MAKNLNFWKPYYVGTVYSSKVISTRSTFNMFLSLNIKNKYKRFLKLSPSNWILKVCISSRAGIEKVNCTYLGVVGTYFYIPIPTYTYYIVCRGKNIWHLHHTHSHSSSLVPSGSESVDVRSWDLDVILRNVCELNKLVRGIASYGVSGFLPDAKI